MQVKIFSVHLIDALPICVCVRTCTHTHTHTHFYGDIHSWIHPIEVSGQLPMGWDLILL